ncbi:conjugative transposon protein TraK [Echinicola sp. 20G]|uniref:conjugative transposon protein TraK n=1 Tax=Echinicola sp. 20G TaxID=2781961 RepID=UPI0019111843|nr:conjugative transposon protein TraK [Echinicola sp. 20G]
MFENLKNIDSAFRHIRLFSLLGIVSVCTLCGLLCFRSLNHAERAQEHIYILAHGKVLEAFSGERNENIAVEAKDHIKMFHHYFFTLAPDENQINNQLSKSLYLADGSAKTAYDNLKEKGYYQRIVAANISQDIKMDSIRLDTNAYPYGFIYYGTQTIVRSSSVLTRNLVTKGRLREVRRSDNNPHGLLIERWETLSNTNQTVHNR